MAQKRRAHLHNMLFQTVHILTAYATNLYPR
jgi:hypothetical protein